MEAMLPPLSPLSVVKVPLLRERPKQRQRVVANQQEMFHTLLSKRRKKYLARVRHHSISEEEKREPEKISYDLIPPSLYSDESSIKSFAEHVIKCAKRRRKKSTRSQRRIARNGVITAKTSVQTAQKSPTDQKLCNSYVVHEKLSSPMKQEIRDMYRLKLTKQMIDHKQLEGDGVYSENQSPCKKPLTSSPIVSPNVKGFAESPQVNNDNPVKRKLTYLSERQSEISPMTGTPNPPPCTPDNEEWSSFYVPSLHDIKSQRLLKSRLLAIETSIKEKQAKERDKEVENKKKKEIEEATKQRAIHREIQRNEIYALNKIMSALEEIKDDPSFITEKV